VNFSRPDPSGAAVSGRQTSPVLRDASTRPIGFDQPVADHDRLCVVLELEVGSEPIVGSLQAGGRRFDFSGWVGLATALEQAISTGADGRRGRSAGTDALPSRLRRLS
jgi:hypothetical protein